MSTLVAATMLVFAFVGGIIGWRRASKPIYRRSLYDPDLPPGVTRRDYERMERTRRKRRRVVVTCLSGLLGAVAGFCLLSLFRN